MLSFTTSSTCKIWSFNGSPSVRRTAGNMKSQYVTAWLSCKNDNSFLLFPWNTRPSDILSSGFESVPVMISFSFARVSATYNTRSSSPRLSRTSSFWITFLIMLGILVLYSRLTASSPTPIPAWRATALLASCILNRFPIPATITTGNSRPLLLWIVITRTVSACSSSILASP